jgi:hypothetical protein
MSLVVVRVLLLEVIDHRDGFFFFFLDVCILDVFRHLVGLQVGCS